MGYRELNESFRRMLMTEDKESKMRSKARAYTRGLGYNEMQAKDVEMRILHDIPNVRLGDFKFMLGVTRIVVSGELDDGGKVMGLNKYLKLIASDAHIGEYDYNLNGMSYSDIDSRFKVEQNEINQAEVEKSNARVFNGDKGYRIVRIPDFDTASEYGDYVNWCVTQDEHMYDSYTGGGIGIFYFCLKEGFERVEEVEGEGCPLDEYGLSMIAVSVNEDGSCNTITCRWNHGNGGNDNIMSVEQLENVIGKNFYKTFVPRSPEELEAKRVDMVEKIYDSFRGDYEYCGNMYEMVEDNYITPLGEWFNKREDDYDSQEEYEMAIDEFNENIGDMLFMYNRSIDYCEEDKYIIVNGYGELMYNDYFNEIWGGDGYNTVFVGKGDKLNLLNVKTGQMMLDTKGLNGGRNYGEFIILFYNNGYNNFVKILDSTTCENILPIEAKSVGENMSYVHYGSYRGMGYFWVRTMDDKYNIALIKDSKFYGWLLSDGQYEDIKEICRCGQYIMLVKEIVNNEKFGVMMNPLSLEPVLNGMLCRSNGWEVVTMNGKQIEVYTLEDINGNKHYMNNRDYSDEIDIGNSPVKSYYDQGLAFEGIDRDKYFIVERLVRRIVTDIDNTL